MWQKNYVWLSSVVIYWQWGGEHWHTNALHIFTHLYLTADPCLTLPSVIYFSNMYACIRVVLRAFKSCHSVYCVFFRLLVIYGILKVKDESKRSKQLHGYCFNVTFCTFTQLKYNFEVLVLYPSISIFYFILLLLHISKGTIEPFTAPHYFKALVTSYYAVSDY